MGEKTKKLVKELKSTLLQKEGVKGIGLSAVQIGNLTRVFIAYSRKSKKFLTFINPEIIWYSKRLTNGIPQSKSKFEGCLSVPGIWAIIKRSSAIKVKYQTEKGTWQIRKFSGLTATVIQHEYDHTEGILFVDRVLEQKGKLYQLKQNKEGKEELVEFNL